MVYKAGLTFDEALTRYVGEWGAGQKRAVFLASLLWLANAFVFFVWVFASLDPVSRHQWSCNDPTDQACMAVFKSSDPKHGLCGLDRSQWSWSSEVSVVAHFNLVCEDAWKVQFVNTAMFIGCFLGAGLFGQINDRFGRRKPLFGATALVAVCMFGSALSPSYWVMMTLRIITGIGAAGQSQCIMLMSTETTGPSFRGLASVASLAFITLGEFLLVALAYAVPHWRYLTLAAAGLNAAGLLLFPFVPESARWLLSKGRTEDALAVLRNISLSNHTSMPLEPLIAGSSPRKAASSQHNQRPAVINGSSDNNILSGSHPLQNSGGTGILMSGSHLLHTSGGSGVIMASNHSLQHSGGSGVVITIDCVHENGSSDGASCGDDSSSVCSSREDSIRLRSLLSNPRLLSRALVLLLVWFTLYFSGYGVVLGSGALPGSIYMTFAMMAASELTGMCASAFLVDRVGRHNILTFGLLLGGGACLGCANAVKHQVVQAVLAIIGKFGCAMASAVLGTYTSENYPTPVRATAMGMFNQAARCGSIAAPCMLMLGSLLGPGGAAGALVLPYLAFGGVSVLSGLLMVFMPETLGADMPETMEDLEQLQTFFAAKPWQGGWWAVIAFLFRRRAVPRPTQEQAVPEPARNSATMPFAGDVAHSNVIC